MSLMQPRIVHEDDEIIVVDKPAGWVVNESSTTKRKEVIQRWLESNFSYPAAGSRELRSGIVHR